MFTRILIGLFIAVAGFMMVWKTEWLVRQTGSFGWAEKYLGTEGGTRLAVKLIGVFCVTVGLMTVVGLHVRFMRWLLSPLLKFPLT